MSTDLVSEYERFGFVGPFDPVEASMVADVRRFLLREEASLNRLERLHAVLPMRVRWTLFRGRASRLHMTRNRHLDVDVVARLCFVSEIEDVLRKTLGDAGVLWRSQLFLPPEERADPGIPWHRDVYDGLLERGATQASIQIALTRSTPENCMVFVPGSHKMSEEQLSQDLGLNRLESATSRAYGTPRYDAAESQFVAEALEPVLMEPGQFVLFHPHLVHASGSMRHGRSARFEPASRRMALALRVASRADAVHERAFEQTLPRRERVVRWPEST